MTRTLLLTLLNLSQCALELCVNNANFSSCDRSFSFNLKFIHFSTIGEPCKLFKAVSEDSWVKLQCLSFLGSFRAASNFGRVPEIYGIIVLAPSIRYVIQSVMLFNPSWISWCIVLTLCSNASSGFKLLLQWSHRNQSLFGTTWRDYASTWV